MTEPPSDDRSVALQRGSCLGPYEIVSFLGAGGMGEVYRALDPRLGRDVAVKVLPRALAADPDRLRRFQQEIRAVGALSHPHILTVHDVGTHDGTPYVVTELLEGETLREVLRRRTPTTRQVLAWGRQAAQGLSAASRKGIVHRDLKPENLFLTTDGRIKLLDFGLAKLTSVDGRAPQTHAATATMDTEPGVIVGTVAYMSPEQVSAEPVDHRSDIFSLGVVLYELLCGENPFRRASVSATLTAILHESPLDLSMRQTGVSPAVVRILARCLEKKRENRFQSAHDLALALEALVEEKSAGASLRDIEERSPYPGLSPFTEADADHYFGREDAVRELWEKLRGRHLLALIGPSGAGKSSFVRAGVVAARPEGWSAIVSTPGTAPLRGLGQALGPELSGDPEALRKLAGFEDPETAVELLARWRRVHDEALVVVDQLEELFTLTAPETQAQFAGLLGRLAGEADIHVLVSLRDDFLMRCHEHPALAPVFGDLTPLGALTREARRSALVEPARRFGYRFEDESLVEEMVDAVEGARGALPLLAFAISRLWDRRDTERKLLTREAYRGIGGVEGALAQNAEATCERIGSDREGIVREIFRNLTTGQGTRAVLDREELLSAFPARAAAEQVLEQLVGARLLTSYETEGREGEPSRHRVEIVHESLLTAWPRLVRWQTQDADGAQLRDQLRQAAHLWEERGRGEDLLWTGASYLDYRAWRERYPGGLSSVEEAFAGGMVDLANRKRRTKRTAVAAFVLALLAGLGVVGTFWRQSRAQALRAEAEAQRAEANRLVALARLELESSPSGALAYVTKSIEIADTEEARHFALSILQDAPTYSLDNADASRMAFNRSGEWLALMGQQRVEIRNRNARDHAFLDGEYPPPSDFRQSLTRLGSAPDSELLVTNRLGDIRVWSIPERREIRAVRESSRSSWLVVRSGGFFTTTISGVNETIRFWPFEGGEPRVVGTEKVTEGSLNSAGTEFAFAAGRKIYVRSWERWSLPPRLLAEDPADVSSVSFGPDGRSVAATNKAGDVRIYPTGGRTGQAVRVLRGCGPVDGIFSPKGRWLALDCSTTHGLIQVWDLTAPPDAEPLVLRGGAGNVQDLKFDPSDRWLVTLNPAFVAFWPLDETHPRVLKMPAGGEIARGVQRLLKFTPDGATLASLEEDGLHAWSMSADGPPSRILVSGRRHGVAIDPNGRRAAVVGEEGRVSVVPVAGGAARNLEGYSDRVGLIAVAFDPDGRRVAAAPYYGPVQEKVIRIWDLESGEVQAIGPIPEAGDREIGGILSLSFLDRNRILATRLGWVPSDPRGLLLFDLTTGKATVLSKSPLTSVVFTGSGVGLGIRSPLHTPDQLVRLGPDGKVLEIIGSHPDAIVDAIDATGVMIASGSVDGAVRIGPISGGEPAVFLGHKGPILDVAFSPDGRWLASAGIDNTIRLWPVPDVAKAPLHKRSHEDFLATLRSWTNLRAIPDATSSTGWKLDLDRFPGWATSPKW